MVALWGATNDHDEQGHHQMPQWIPPTLTSSSNFSRFVIRPWSSGNWSANQTTQTLLSCLICCKLKYKAIPDMEQGCGPFTGQKSARPGSNRLLEPMTNYSFLSYSANGQKPNTCFCPNPTGNQLAIYKRGRGSELGTTDNETSKWLERVEWQTVLVVQFKLQLNCVSNNQTFVGL